MGNRSYNPYCINWSSDPTYNDHRGLPCIIPQGFFKETLYKSSQLPPPSHKLPPLARVGRGSIHSLSALDLCNFLMFFYGFYNGKSPWKTSPCWWFLLFTFYPWSMDHPKLGLVFFFGDLLTDGTMVNHWPLFTSIWGIFFGFFPTTVTPSQAKVQSVVCFENPRVVANGGWLVRNFVVYLRARGRAKGLPDGYHPETNSLPLKIWWLEDGSFPFGMALLVSGRVKGRISPVNAPPENQRLKSTSKNHNSLQGNSSSKSIIFWLHGVLPESMEWVKQEHVFC